MVVGAVVHVGTEDNRSAASMLPRPERASRGPYEGMRIRLAILAVVALSHEPGVTIDTTTTTGAGAG